jgi:peptidylprolyl isomerase
MDAVRRPIHPVLAVAAIPLGVLLALAACATRPPVLGEAAPTPTPTAPACAQPGPASDSVLVDADLGEAPVIVADGPYDVDRVERTVLIAGAGDPVVEGDLVAVAITIVNATSGERAPGTASARVLLEPDAVQPGLLATILCTPPGSRVVGVVPAEQAFGVVGQPELAIGPDDDLVLVVDVLTVIPQQAAGAEVPLPDGFPPVHVRVGSDGAPTVGIPDIAPPPTTVSAVLIEGTGPVVASGDEFLVQFVAVNWRTHEEFDGTWGDVPRSLLTVLPGVDAALVGRTVGSRVVAVVAPTDGFGSTGSPSSGVLPTDTVVYVVDILATTPPPAS